MRQAKNLYPLILLIFTIFVFTSCEKTTTPEWPEQTNETKPWTRWWWHGSAVDKANLTANLEELAKAGFGGVEITPIYDVKGDEDKSISFQSAEWMEMFEHTLKEAKRLGLGVDLANASGWPFGGPWIDAEQACKNLQYKKYHLKSGEQLKEKIEFIQPSLVRAVNKRVDISEVKFPISSNTNLQELALDQVRFEKPLPLQTLMAFNMQGETIDLTNFVNANGILDWTAPEGNWDLYAVFQGWHGKMVERAGTGGEGNVIDHFSEEATKIFLSDFDKNVKDIDLTGLRAFFNDSYEVDDASGDANWTPLFFEEFEKRRGYDLKTKLPALFGDMDEETNQRVLCDFRETISDLLLDKFTIVWADWAESYNTIIRNQAHGSPAAILD
uniref:glycosyl hydrolase n=1 Tax=Draconibacterium sp. TaxID=1965318 RepID=UPI0035660AFB